MFDMLDKLVKNAQKMAESFADELVGEGDEITMKCPSCGAKVKGNEFDSTFVCEYCGDIIQNNVSARKKQKLKEKMGTNYFEGQNVHSEVETQNFHKHAHETCVDEVYAVISHEGLFYNGEVPGIKFAEARLCTSFDECVNQLKEKVNDKRKFVPFKTPEYSREELESKYPHSKIIKL